MIRAMSMRLDQPLGKRTLFELPRAAGLGLPMALGAAKSEVRAIGRPGLYLLTMDRVM